MDGFTASRRRPPGYPPGGATNRGSATATLQRAANYTTNGKMSLYPLAAVWSDRSGLALGLDMEHPAQHRLVYHAGTKQFFIAYDFGLVQDTAKFPRSAEFRFVLYSFDSRWGFRAALQRYYDLFPQHFTKRVTREGVWMPFSDIASVPGFEDFGFAFQEGAPNVAFDDQHGIASFVYVEPMSHWLAMPRAVPRTYESAMAVLTNDLAGARDKQAADMAAATLTSGIQNTDGRLALYLVKAPWCDGGVFTLNPDPDIPTTRARPYNKAMVMRRAIEAAFQKHQPKQASAGESPSPQGSHRLERLQARQGSDALVVADRERAALLAFLRRLLGTYAEREDGTDLLSRGSGTELDRWWAWP